MQQQKIPVHYVGSSQSEVELLARLSLEPCTAPYQAQRSPKGLRRGVTCAKDYSLSARPVKLPKQVIGKDFKIRSTSLQDKE